MIGSTIQGRYRIKEVIGKGGIGTVYRARDDVLNREVALKLLNRSALGSQDRARLLQEAQTVANLNHPNIVVVHDAGEHDHTPYLVMELVGGRTLYEKAPEGLSAILKITNQICQALDHAHQQGIVHRDLKPENVIIEPDGNLKLMDFGLARSITSRMSQEGKIIGTVHYISPEQVTGGELDGRADLYALGVMLYEWVTGSLPFHAKDPVSVIAQHVHAPVVPPRAKRDDLPRHINRLILSLLSKDPSDRPSSAAEVLQRITSPADTFPAPMEREEFSLLDRITRGRIIGRESEVQLARNLWSKAAGGDGQVLLLSGEPGIGKTRLANEIATHVNVRGGQTLQGESFAERGPPYGAISQILRTALDQYPSIHETVPEDLLADLRLLIPDLQLTRQDLPSRPFMDPQFEQQRLLESTITFLATLAEQSPLLLLLEDLHWADRATIHMVRHLARRTRKMPIMILITYREVEVEDEQLFQEFLLDMDRARLATRVKLSRLDRGQTGELLSALFQEEISPELLEEIHRETEGNPFFIEEICKSLVESGQVYFEMGEWQLPDNIADLIVPQSIKTTIERRLNHLSESSRQVLTLASVIGREFDFDVLLQLSSTDEASLLDVIDEALGAQLIREKRVNGRYKYSFEHALINHTLYEELNLRRKTRLHQQVGTAMERAYADRMEAHLDELAHHFFLGASGETIEKAIHYNEQAAERALGVFAFDDAVSFYQQVIQLLEDANRIPQTIPYWMKIGDVHLSSISRNKAVEHYLKAIELWEGLTEEEKAREVGASAYSRTGEARRWGVIVPGARGYVEKGLAMVEDQPTMARARLLKGLAWVTSFLAPVEEMDLDLAEQAGLEALSLFKTHEAPDEVSSTLDCLASIHARTGNPMKGLEITEQRMEFIEQVSLAERLDTFHMLGDYSYLLNDFSQSEQYERLALKIASENSLFSWEFQVMWDLARLYLEWERWDDALHTIHAYLSLNEKTGGVYWNSNLSVPGLAQAAATIHQLRGEPDMVESMNPWTSTDHLPEDEVERSFRMHRDRVLNVELLLLVEDLQGARALMEAVHPDRLHWTNPLRLHYLELALADDPPLSGLVDLESRVLEETPWDELLLAKVRRLAGAGYQKTGELEKAGEVLGQALRGFKELETRWQQGKTLATLGDLQAEQGKREEAMTFYDRAVKCFESVSARHSINHIEEKRRQVLG